MVLEYEMPNNHELGSHETTVRTRRIASSLWKQLSGLPIKNMEVSYEGTTSQKNQSKTAFTQCRQILKMVKNVTAAKFEQAFTWCRNNLKTVGSFDCKNSLQDFDAREMYLHPKNQSVSCQKCREMFCFLFSSFSTVHTTQCRFQNVPVRVPRSGSIVFKIWKRYSYFEDKHLNDWVLLRKPRSAV